MITRHSNGILATVNSSRVDLTVAASVARRRGTATLAKICASFNLESCQRYLLQSTVVGLQLSTVFVITLPLHRYHTWSSDHSTLSSKVNGVLLCWYYHIFRLVPHSSLNYGRANEKNLYFTTKLDIIRCIEEGKKNSSILDGFGIASNTLDALSPLWHNRTYLAFSPGQPLWDWEWHNALYDAKHKISQGYPTFSLKWGCILVQRLSFAEDLSLFYCEIKTSLSCCVCGICSC